MMVFILVQSNFQAQGKVPNPVILMIRKQVPRKDLPQAVVNTRLEPEPLDQAVAYVQPRSHIKAIEFARIDSCGTSISQSCRGDAAAEGGFGDP